MLLQVRECPEDIYEKIAITAKRQKRTIAQQTVALIEKGLGQEESNLERRNRLLSRIEKRTIAAKAKTVDAVALIREDRER